MMLPAIILAIVTATLIGASFHILQGGSLQRLGLHLLAANISFFSGQVLSNSIGWHLLRVGEINLFPAVLAAIIGLIVTAALAGEDIEAAKQPKKRGRTRR